MSEDYFQNNPTAELGSDDGRRLKFCSYGYERPNGKGSDADWHMNYLVYTHKGVRVEVRDSFLTGFLLAQFAKELEEFCNFKRDEVELEPFDPYLGLKFTFTQSKHVNAKGYIRINEPYKTEVNFLFETNLPYLDIFLKGIQQILLKYPPRK